jgi:putative endonuclease
MDDARRLGVEAEEESCRLLRGLGYRIVSRNWRIRSGEIDIVARDGDVLVFVEVKARSGDGFGGPEAAVGPAKRRRMIAAAKAFVSRTGCDLPARFDVVVWEGGRARVHRDAFRIDDVRSTD